MKNYSISIEHKDEAIPLFEQLGYKEDKEWNYHVKNREGITHILAYEGMWGFYNHDGGFYNHDGSFNNPVTIEELRELVNQTLTPQNAHKE